MISGLSASQGPTSGGTAFTILGANFQPGATATLGGVPVTGLAWVDANTLSAAAPPGAAGWADLAVLNPDGQSAALAGAFLYKAPVATPPDGPNEIEAHAPSPNPNPGFILAKLKGSADSVELKVFTKAMACVALLRLGPQGPGWCRVVLPSGLASAASGVYHYEITSERGGSLSKPGKGNFMIIR